MSEQSSDAIDVSFAELAAEDNVDSVAHEGNAVSAVEANGPAPDPELTESDNDSPPVEPTIASVSGVGPVSDGENATI